MAVMLCTIGVCALLLRQRSRRGRDAALRIFSGDDSDVHTHIYIEAADVSCDFQMRFSHDELETKETLLKAIARAGFEATEMPFRFGSARVERLDDSGTAKEVKTDADCRHLRKAKGIRVTQSASLGESDGLMLLEAQDDDETDAPSGGGDRESLLLSQF